MLFCSLILSLSAGDADCSFLERMRAHAGLLLVVICALYCCGERNLLSEEEDLLRLLLFFFLIFYGSTIEFRLCVRKSFDRRLSGYVRLHKLFTSMSLRAYIYICIRTFLRLPLYFTQPAVITRCMVGGIEARIHRPALRVIIYAAPRGLEF